MICTREFIGDDMKRNLHVGQKYEETKIYSIEDIDKYSNLTGDDNPGAYE